MTTIRTLSYTCSVLQRSPQRSSEYEKVCETTKRSTLCVWLLENILFIIFFINYLPVKMIRQRDATTTAMKTRSVRRYRCGRHGTPNVSSPCDKRATATYTCCWLQQLSDIARCLFVFISPLFVFILWFIIVYAYLWVTINNSNQQNENI